MYGVFAMSCALDVPLIGVTLGREHLGMNEWQEGQ
jgi:hypothetical protein